MIQYSQRDARWARDILGFADSGTTIASYGCLLTASAMVLSNHGFIVDPGTLNKKLKQINGFAGGLMYFNSLASLYPVKVNLISCNKEPAPLQLIEESVDNGLFVIVEVDSSPRPGFQNHWVVIHRREGIDKYYISDPWALSPESENETLQRRYGFAGGTSKIITNVLIIEPLVRTTKQADKQQDPYAPKGDKFVVVMDGLRLRQSPSTMTDAIGMLKAGTQLISAGESFPVGEIVWQPVVMYVATAYNGDQYIKPED